MSETAFLPLPCPSDFLGVSADPVSVNELTHTSQEPTKKPQEGTHFCAPAPALLFGCEDLEGPGVSTVTRAAPVCLPSPGPWPWWPPGPPLVTHGSSVPVLGRLAQPSLVARSNLWALIFQFDIWAAEPGRV